MLSTLRKLLNKNPLREISETDRKVLLICISAAFVFWLILNLSQNYSIRRTVDINYLVDQERTVSKDEEQPVPSSQGIVIDGQGWDLMWESFRFNNMVVELDLRGKKSLVVTRSDLQNRIQRKLSSGELKINNLDFSRLEIFTTPKEGKRVPVASLVITEFSDGYLATKAIQFTPDSVTISGSADALALIYEWPTEEITIEDVEQNLRQTVGLKLAENGLTVSRASVLLDLPVEAFIQRKIEVPVTVINAPEVDSFQVIPEMVTLIVSLPQSSYNSVRASEFSLVADLGNIRNQYGKNSVPLLLARQPATVIGVSREVRSVEYYLIN